MWSPPWAQQSMAGIRYNLPPQLDLTGNTAENFRQWKLLFTNYMDASKQQLSNDVDKINLLFNLAGHQVILKQEAILRRLSEAEKKDYTKVLGALRTYCGSLHETNEVFERYMFHKRDQEPNESFEHFYEAIQKLVRTCNYKEQSKELRDRIVQGISDSRLQELLLQLSDLTEEKVVAQCRAAERSKIQVQKIKPGEAVAEVHHVYKEKPKNNNTNKHKTEKPKKKEEESSKVSNMPSGDTKKLHFRCINCNLVHPPRKCPAYGLVCDTCKGKNHFTSECRWQTAVEEIVVIPSPQEQETWEPSEVFILEQVQVDESHKNITKFEPGQKKEWREELLIENIPVNTKLDPGSEINALPVKIFSTMGKNQRLRPGPRLALYGGKVIIPTLGSAVLEVECRGEKYYLEFQIVETGTPILGIEDSERLNLVRRVHHVEAKQEDKEKFIADNLDVFTGTGKFPGELKLVLAENAEVKQSVPHRVPKSINKKLKPQLDQMENRGIIARVTQINNKMVVNNLVVFEKSDGSLRICLDPAELNKAIKRRPCFIPTIAEIKEKMANKWFYSVFDLKEGFYHCELDQTSSELCCFATQHGVYRFLRLPFGLASAPEDFQAINQENFGDIEGVIIYIDDLGVPAKTKEEHDRLVDLVLARARERNVKFNPKKVQYCQTEIKYVGHIFTAGGHKPDHDRVRALMEMPAPQNRADIDRAMGMFNYVREYIPHMSTIASPLRALMKKKALWVWRPDHEQAFNELKLALAKVTLLTCPDVNLPFELQCDASKDGLGACLLQQGKPVSFTSRAMNSAECNYSQTEKELLAIVEGFKKHHSLLYGAEVSVVTDHKPLVFLMKKQIEQIGSNRLKLLRLKILKYQFAIEYRPGKQMYLADHFSRSYLPETVEEDEDLQAVVHSITTVPVSTDKLLKIRNATQEDVTLQKIGQYVLQGWPNQMSKLPAACRPYWQHRVDLHVQDGVLMFGQKIVLPASLRRDTMEKLHAGHTGRDKTIARARLSVYWPNYAEDIAHFVAECTTCAKFRPRLSTPELLPHDIPKLVWSKLGLDLLRFAGEDYLVVMDYFSKWLEILKVPSKHANTIITALVGIFAVHGYPQTVICDNNPFNSYDFNQYAKGKFDVITTSPTYASSNGLAESAVGIAKGILNKAHEENQDYRELLREYRATPISGFDYSPAQILFSRQIQTAVPITEQGLQPKIIQAELHKQMMTKKEEMKTRLDKKVRRREVQYHPGQQVLLRNRHEKYWLPGEVVSAHPTPRSYWVKKPNGEVVRRNESHMRLDTQQRGTQNQEQEELEQDNPQDQMPEIPEEIIVLPEEPVADEEVMPNPENVSEETEDVETLEEPAEKEFALVLPEYFFDL